MIETKSSFNYFLQQKTDERESEIDEPFMQYSCCCALLLSLFFFKLKINNNNNNKNRETRKESYIAPKRIYIDDLTYIYSAYIQFEPFQLLLLTSKYLKTKKYTFQYNGMSPMLYLYLFRFQSKQNLRLFQILMEW